VPKNPCAINKEKEGQHSPDSLDYIQPLGYYLSVFRVLIRLVRGTDLAPPGVINTSHNGMGISTELIPKSATRVLDAARIRAEYRQKKRARMQMEGAADTNAYDDHMGGATKLSTHKRRRTDVGAGAEKSKVLAKGKGKGHHPVDTQAIEIQPGESLKHFNR
jgi:hypothetical protein